MKTKHRFMLLAALMGFALSGMAQQLDINQLNSFITVTADGVNLRNAPDTASPRLMIQYNDESGGIVWSNEKLFKGYTREGVHPYMGEFYPILEDVGEWYKILYSTDYAGSFEAYISKKFCKVLKKVDITAKTNFSNYDSTIKHINHVDDVFVKDNSSSEGQELAIGQLINGMIVFNIHTKEDCHGQAYDLDYNNLSNQQIKDNFEASPMTVVLFQTATGFGQVIIESNQLKLK